MKFEEYIKEHKSALEHKDDLTNVWDDIKDRIPPFSEVGASNSKRYITLISLVGLLLLSIATYHFLNAKPDTQNTLDYANLYNKQPLEKILAIKSNKLSQGNEKEIIKTLLSIVENDESVNVRLAAIRALEKFIEIDEVKIYLIELLTTEDEPYLTVAVMNMLQRGKVKESLSKFDEIIHDQTHLKFVKEEAIKGQEFLKSI